MDWYAPAVPLLGRRVAPVAESLHNRAHCLPANARVQRSSSERIPWSHQQQFRSRRQPHGNIDYATSSSVISRNAVDPVLAVSNIPTAGQLPAALRLGLAVRGWQPTQSLSQSQVNMTLPVVAFHSEPDRDIAGRDLEPLVQPFQCAPHARPVRQPGSNTIFSGVPGDSAVRFTNNRQTSLAVATLSESGGGTGTTRSRSPISEQPARG